MSSTENEKTVEADEVDEAYDDQVSGLPKWIPFIVVLVAFIGFGGLAWIAYDSGSRKTEYSEVPMVKADRSTYREKPQDEGGMRVDDTDKEIFEAAAGRAEKLDDVGGSAAHEEEKPMEEIRQSAANQRSRIFEDENHPARHEKVGDVERKRGGASEGSHRANKDEEAESEQPFSIRNVDNLEKAKKSASAEESVGVNKYSAKQERVKTADSKRKEIVKQEKSAAEKAKASAGTVKIQLGAFKTENEALTAWKNVSAANKSVFSGIEHNVTKADVAGKGTFYRLQAGGFASRPDAAKVCRTVKSPNGCFVVLK